VSGYVIAKERKQRAEQVEEGRLETYDGDGGVAGGMVGSTRGIEGSSPRDEMLILYTNCSKRTVVQSRGDGERAHDRSFVKTGSKTSIKEEEEGGGREKTSHRRKDQEGNLAWVRSGRGV